MIDVRRTPEFLEWLRGLRDRRAQDRIAARIVRMEAGLMGDVKYFEGIGELRIDYGPGYRLYFMREGAVLVVLLCGGDKGSQKRDIARAKALAERYLP